MKRYFLLCAAPLLITSGCATTTAGDAPNEAVIQREYRTGSNIPKKEPDNVKTYDREALERVRETTMPPLPPGAARP